MGGDKLVRQDVQFNKAIEQVKHGEVQVEHNRFMPKYPSGQVTTHLLVIWKKLVTHERHAEELEQVKQGETHNKQEFDELSG